jgi:hypothetical protein
MSGNLAGALSLDLLASFELECFKGLATLEN